MIKEFKVTEEQDTLVVSVELVEFCRRTGKPKFGLEQKDVRRRLTEEGHEVGACLSGPPELKNWNLSTIRGNWVFEKKKLDKPAKPVIIKEEKSVQPKPPRKKRTRSSAKKVSTED